jgi:hypothetical protein
MSRAIEKGYDSGSHRDGLPPDRPIDVRFVSRSVDRRAAFFVVAAIVCALLVPVTPSELQTVGEVLVVVYLLLALASWLDFRSRK